MAYDLHIEYANPNEEYAPEAIPLEQWRSAVAATEGVRLYAGEVHIMTIPGPRQSLPLKMMNLLRPWRRPSALRNAWVMMARRPAPAYNDDTPSPGIGNFNQGGP
jgi:hypothetical protein